MPVICATCLVRLSVPWRERRAVKTCFAPDSSSTSTADGVPGYLCASKANASMACLQEKAPTTAGQRSLIAEMHH